MERDLETICLKCLEKEPQRRYGSAEALAQDLERWLADEPIQARPSTPLEKSVKWVRRRPAVAALLAVSALGLVGLLILAGFLWQNAEKRAQAVQDLQAARQEQQLAEEHVEAKRAEVQHLENFANLTQTKLQAASATAQQILYDADMQFAHAAWETENVPRMMTLLERYLPQPNQEDRRGFEWHYLRRLSQGDLFTRNAHPYPKAQAGKVPAPFNPVLVALAADGKTMASTGADQTIRLWELATGKLLRTIERPAGLAVAMGFGTDANLILITLKQRDFQAWSQEIMDVRSGKSKPSLKGLADALAFQEYSLGEGKGPKTGNADLARLPAPVSFLPAMASGSEAGRMLFGLAVPFPDAALAPFCLALDPDKKILALGGALATVPTQKDPRMKQEMAIVLWDLTAGHRKTILKGDAGFILAVAFSPDGGSLASTSFDGTIKLWDLAKGQERAVLKGHSGRVLSLAYTPDGKLVSGAADGVVKVWDPASATVLISLRGHRFGITNLAVTGDGRTLVSGSADGYVKAWNPASQPGPVVVKGWNRVTSLAFSADSRNLAGLDKDKKIKFCAALTGQELPAFEASKTISSLECFAYSSDGKSIALAGSGDVKLWDLATRKEVQTLTGHTGPVIAIVFSPDGKTLTAAGRHKTIRHWQLATGKELAMVKDVPLDGRSFAWSRDGQRYAVADRHLVKIREAATGNEQQTIDTFPDNIRVLAFSPDGKRLAMGGDMDDLGRASGVKIWVLATGREVLALGGSGSVISGLNFSPDGRRLAAILSRGNMLNPLSPETVEVKIWDATPGPP